MNEENKNIAETIFENAPQPITVYENDEIQFRKIAVCIRKVKSLGAQIRGFG